MQDQTHSSPENISLSQTIINELAEFVDGTDATRLRKHLRKLVMVHLSEHEGDLGEDFRFFLSDLEKLFQLLEVISDQDS